MKIEGAQTLLEPNAAQAVAVVLHELATNAAKYGSLSVPDGQVGLTWLHEADGRLILRWTEMGGPAVKTPTHRGFGACVIERMIGQLNGKARFDWRTDGTRSRNYPSAVKFRTSLTMRIWLPNWPDFVAAHEVRN